MPVWLVTGLRARKSSHEFQLVDVLKEPAKWRHVALINSDDAIWRVLITCTSKWLSCVIVIGQLHVDISTSPLQIGYRNCMPWAILNVTCWAKIRHFCKFLKFLLIFSLLSWVKRVDYWSFSLLWWITLELQRRPLELLISRFVQDNWVNKWRLSNQPYLKTETSYKDGI